MATTIRPKQRQPLTKKATPKNGKAAKALLESGNEIPPGGPLDPHTACDEFNRRVSIWDWVVFDGENARTTTAAGVQRGLAMVFLAGRKGAVPIGDVTILDAPPESRDDEAACRAFNARFDVGEMFRHDGDLVATLSPADMFEGVASVYLDEEDYPVPIATLLAELQEWEAESDFPAADSREPRAESRKPFDLRSQSICRQPVIELPLEDLRRHPDNREPTEAAVLALAARFGAEGQLEPILVRDLPRGGFQVVSGETRWLAAEKLGWRTIAGRVVACDDDQALELLAIANAARTDLNDIEKARTIDKLCQRGKTREQAGAIYGLSASAASNLVRLLELPQVWQDRVASGELPQTFARELLAYLGWPQLMAALEKDYQAARKAIEKDGDDTEMWSWSTRSAMQEMVEDKIRELGKRLDQRHYYNDGGWSGSCECLLDLTDDAIRKQIDYLELPLGERGAPVGVARNVKVFRKLQIAAIKATESKKAKTKAAKGGADKPQPKKKLTAAEQKKKTAEAAKHLERRIHEWRQSWLHALVHREIAGHALTTLDPLACWLMTQPLVNARMDFERVAVDLAKQRGFAGKLEVWDDPWPAIRHLDAEGRRELVLALARQALAKERIDDDMLADLAHGCDLDLAAEWEALQNTAAQDQVDRLEAFLLLHQSDQLADLAKELGVSLDGCATKQAKIDKFLNSEKTLELPKAIEPLEKPKAESGKRKAKKGAKR